MSATPESKEEIRQLFRRHVPEIETGAVEVVYVARDVGRRSYIAVHAHEAQVDSVGACTGVRGVRAKAMVAELNGEHLTIVRWDQSPERFIRNAFGGLHPPEVVLDQPARRALVTIDQPSPQPSDVRLIAELTGWQISLRDKKQ